MERRSHSLSPNGGLASDSPLGETSPELPSEERNSNSQSRGPLTRGSAVATRGASRRPNQEAQGLQSSQNHRLTTNLVQFDRVELPTPSNPDLTSSRTSVIPIPPNALPNSSSRVRTTATKVFCRLLPLRTTQGG